MIDYNKIGLRPLEEDVIEQKKKKNLDKVHDEYRKLGLKDNLNESQD